MTTDSIIARRQARLSTKVLVTWVLVGAAYSGYKLFGFSPFLPVAALFFSRIFLWPAFPRASRIAWTVFWCAQVLLFVPSITSAVIWGIITSGLFGFIFVSDAVLLYRGYRIAHANKQALPG